MGLHQTEKFCTVKETISKMKRQPTEWEKIFKNNTSNKGLISRLYEELIQLNTHTHTHTRLKTGRGLEQTFLPRGHTNGQWACEKMLSITNQGNGNQNYNEVSPHTCQNDRHQKLQ